ncbi:MAG: hypothetical protein N3E44_00080 [Candidatus Bathyarchaeota archaeon]|nr:hypothetical protein [Candidatus Bathyarchaeota archaeon]
MPNHGELNHEKFRRGVFKLSHRLKVEYTKLEQTVNEMKIYLHELYDKCESAFKLGQPLRAKMYANESVKVEELIRQLLHVQFIIERVLIRLETLKEIGRILSLLPPITEALKYAGTTISDVIPEASKRIDKMLSDIEPLLNSTTGEADRSEVERILCEAKAAVEERVKLILPEPPKEVYELLEEAKQG